jgi:hypothetical protein
MMIRAGAENITPADVTPGATAASGSQHPDLGRPDADRLPGADLGGLAELELDEFAVEHELEVLHGCARARHPRYEPWLVAER